LIYAFVVGLGHQFLQLFNVNPDEMKLAFEYLAINAIFLLMVPFSVGGLMIFQATNQMVMANFIAILQGFLT
jgi:Na+-driven multidrug efflux pump